MVHDPATGAELVAVQAAGIEQVDAAVRTAHAAHFDWRARSPRERGRYLREAAGAVRDHAEEIAQLETSDNGKPISEARGDVTGGIAKLEYFADLCEVIPGGVRDSGDMLDITLLEPFGVVAGIVPFNWPPVHTAGRPLAPALVVGNAVVIKPPEQAPLSAIRIAEVIAAAIPDDVVHVVPGPGSTGAQLAGHPLVGKISFTGSPTTAAAVAGIAAERLAPASMELGGKNPFVIFDDADLESALPWALEGGFFNAGQACTAASRVLVHASRYEEVVSRYGAAVRGLRVGRGSGASTQVGPVVSASHRDRVIDYINLGVAEGAAIAAQAPIPDDPALAGGYYVPPTLFTDVTPDMRVAREEIFGPVVCVMSFEDEEEAIRIANGTDFGLVAAVFTRDSERQIRVGRAIRAGVVFVNSYSRALLGTPFGGSRLSGYGREGAHQTLAEYGHTKGLRLPSGVGVTPHWPVADEAFA
jgi:acyl-CoA reductase-like NAD-dependent aldehyde dehydrogenase